MAVILDCWQFEVLISFTVNDVSIFKQFCYTPYCFSVPPVASQTPSHSISCAVFVSINMFDYVLKFGKIEAPSLDLRCDMFC